MPVTIPVTLPDELAEQARTKGLLSSAALARIIGEAIDKDKPIVLESVGTYPPDMDSRLEGAVNPSAFRRGEITGDVVSPLGVVWEANP